MFGPGCLPVDRTVDQGRRRSTGPIDRCVQTCTSQKAGGPVDRADRPPESLLSENGPGRPNGRLAESCCSLFPVPVDRAVDRWLNGHKNDCWLVDRAVDRKVISDLSRLPTSRILEGYKYAFSWVVLHKFLESNFFHLCKCLTTSF